MSAEKPPLRGPRVAAIIGTTLAVVGAMWLAVLAVQSLRSPTEVVVGERAIPLLPVEPTTTPPLDPATSDPEPQEPVTPDAATQDTGTPDTGTPDTGSEEPPADPDPDAADGAADRTPLTPRLLIDSDLGTGSAEFSAVALNEQANRLLIADDAGLLFEFELDGAGLPITPARRTIRVATGAGDIEGISWLANDSYAIAHEDDGKLTVVDLDDQVTTISDDQVTRVVDTLVREENGNGLEGVAFVSSGTDVEFVVVDERPPTLYAISRSGSVAFSVADGFGVTDLSDIFASPDGSYTAVSDEGRVVIDFVIDASGGIEIIDTISLELTAGRFEQPEGVVRSRDGNRLYVVGEAPGPGRFSFGLWSRE